MGWFLLVVLALIGLIAWVAVLAIQPRNTTQPEGKTTLNRSTASQPAQHPPSTTTWQERVAGIEAAREAPARPAAAAISKLEVSEDGVTYDYTNHPLLQAIAPMTGSGQWDAARRYLQKIAYGVKSASEQEQREFKHLMMAFAAVDPLYAQCLRGIAPILAEHPEGIRQTALYPHMAAAPDAETARYVLYYADALGAIRRQKKGNSYLVFAASGGANVDLTIT